MDLAFLPVLIVVVACLFGLFILFFVFKRLVKFYHRVSPSQVYVIYGRKNKQKDIKETKSTDVRLVTGGGTWILPFIEEYQTLDLTVMTIEQSGDKVYTVDGIAINLDWVAQVQIASEQASLYTAAKAFLGKSPEDVINIITLTLSTNFRAIVGQMNVEGVHRDRDSFTQKVQSLANDEMLAMGVSIISMGVKEITDGVGYFESMAAPKIAENKKNADIATAESNRDSRLKKAAADKTAKQAELDAEREILEQEQTLELRKVEKDQKVRLANADADRVVSEQVALANKQKQEAEVLVPARAAQEAAKINAEASRVKVTIEAEAEAAATKTKAEATAESTRKTGEAEASIVQAKALATATGIEANLLAEAKGKRELAEATSAQGEVNLRQYIAELLINGNIKQAEAIATALAGIGEKVHIVQFGGGSEGGNAGDNVLSNLLGSIPELFTMTNEKVKALNDGQSIEDVLRRVISMIGGAAAITNNKTEEKQNVATPQQKEQSSVEKQVEVKSSETLVATVTAPEQKNTGRGSRKVSPK